MDDEFLLGDALLVAPITRPGIEHRHVYLPEGTWSHFFTGERLDGPSHVLAHAPLGEPAVYLKANTPLPVGLDAAHAGEVAGPLTVRVHPAAGAAPGSTTLYEDAGDGFGHEDGGFARRTVSCEASGNRVTVLFGEREGSFAPPRETVTLELRGVGAPRGVTVGGEAAESRPVEGGIQVTLPETAAGTTVEVTL